MIFSAAVDPRAFTREHLHNKLAAREALEFLRGISCNGVLVDISGRNPLRELYAALDTLGMDWSQKLKTLVAELQKSKKRHVVELDAADGTIRSDHSLERLRFLASCGFVDLVIPATESDLHEARSCSSPATEVAFIEDYSTTKTESLSRAFLSPRIRIDQMQDAERVNYFGRFVRFARRIVIVDKMLGPASMRGGHALMPFVQGVQFVLDAWRATTPYSRETLPELELLTYRTGGAAFGHVDPAVVRRSFLASLVDECGREVAKRTRVLVMDDFPEGHARFLYAKNRCIRIDPGLDALGKLHNDCEAGSSDRQVFVDGPSQANLDSFGAIRQLKEL